MDKNRESDIDKLLEKMREENLQYREGNTKKEIDIDDDEEDIIIQSRYHDSKKENKEVPQEGKKLEKRKKKKNKKNKETDNPAAESKENEKKPKKKSKKMKTRPSTAKPKSKHLQSTTRLKKADKLTLFLSRQQEWQSIDFLRANTLHTREGRKLDLISRLKQKPFEIKKKSDTLHQRNDYIPIHEKRRDELRFTTRIKMLSF